MSHKIFLFNLITSLLLCSSNIPASHATLLNRELLSVWIPSFDTSPLIDLSSKRISFIDKNTFKGLSYVKELNLFDNQLTELDAEIFVDLVDLERLDLDNNLLTYIQPSRPNEKRFFKIFKCKNI